MTMGAVQNGGLVARRADEDVSHDLCFTRRRGSAYGSKASSGLTSLAPELKGKTPGPPEPLRAGSGSTAVRGVAPSWWLPWAVCSGGVKDP